MSSQREECEFAHRGVGVLGRIRFVREGWSDFFFYYFFFMTESSRVDSSGVRESELRKESFTQGEEVLLVDKTIRLPGEGRAVSLPRSGHREFVACRAMRSG